MIGNVEIIDYQTAVDFLLPKHYSGRTPSISIAFGWYIDNKLVAVSSFGKPASNSLCKGLAGDVYSSNVYELNRLCRIEELDQPLSSFLAACLRQLKARNWIIVSYADTDMKHNGYIYQATNFIYTGKTKERTDKYTKGNRHSRHYSEADQTGMRKIRSAKHRYIFFATNSKSLKKEWLANLNYPVQAYPKGKNKNYKLGSFLKPRIKA